MEEGLKSQREEKAATLRNLGFDPFPAQVDRTHTAEEVISIIAEFSDDQTSDESTKVSITGRIMARRSMGRASFFDIVDGTSRIQILFRKNTLSENLYDNLNLLDLGDFISVKGYPMKPRTGEATVEALDWKMLSKSLLPPPEKFHGLKNIELRQRQRYLDLIASDEVKTRFLLRSAITGAIRTYLKQKDYIEVETPILQPEAGGAAAKPFTTHA